MYDLYDVKVNTKHSVISDWLIGAQLIGQPRISPISLRIFIANVSNGGLPHCFHQSLV